MLLFKIMYSVNNLVNPIKKKKKTFYKLTGPTAELDWWQVIYLIAIFLFRFPTFGEFFYSTPSILLTEAAVQRWVLLIKGFLETFSRFTGNNTGQSVKSHFSMGALL